MRLVVTDKDYAINIYNKKGPGFYPLTFIISTFLSISLATQSDIYILFTTLILGVTALPISIYRVVKNINNIGSISIDVASLNAIEDEHISMTISFDSKLFELLKFKRLSVISDAGIKISEIRFRKLKDVFSIEILLQGFCGKHQIRSMVLFLSDPLFYINYRIELILVKPILIHIIPKQTYIELDVERNIPYISYEARLSRRKGLGVNILGIREYLPDDDYRRIDWKATARTSKLMVKEFEKHLCRDVLFIASINDRFFVGNPPALAYLLRIILNLLIRIVNAGINLGIGIATENEVIISNKITKYGLKHIYETLSQVTWPLIIEKKSYSSANRIIRWFVNELVNKFCSESCLVIIFIDIIDDLDAENVRKILKELMIRHHTLRVFLIQPTTIRFLLSSIELNEFNDLRSELNAYKHAMKYFKGVNIVSSVTELL